MLVPVRVPVICAILSIFLHLSQRERKLCMDGPLPDAPLGGSSLVVLVWDLGDWVLPSLIENTFSFVLTRGTASNSRDKGLRSVVTRYTVGSVRVRLSMEYLVLSRSFSLEVFIPLTCGTLDKLKPRL